MDGVPMRLLQEHNCQRAFCLHRKSSIKTVYGGGAK